MRPLADDILIPADRIAGRVRQLAREIERDTPPGEEIAALIVLKGAFVFGADLLRAIERRTRVGFLEIHRQVEEGPEVEFVFTHPFPIEGRDVLVIEDILDTGVTMNALLERLRARRPSRLRTAVLLDKRSRREVECPVEYVGFEIPDLWVVGYGLDDDERYRNLPAIGYVSDEA